MLTVNGFEFVTNKKDITESTKGFYKVVKNGIQLLDLNKEPKVFIFDNGRSDMGLVSFRRYGNGFRYQYSMIEVDEKWIGLHGCKYSRECEVAEIAIYTVKPNKYVLSI